MALHEIPALNFTPDGNIKLLSGVPLTKDYQHTRLFESEDQQTNYFNSKIKRASAGATYIRKNGVIRIESNAELLFDVNYLMFQNTNYSNKWFYAFVTDIEYSNPSTSFIHFKIDVMQTWQFKIQLKPSFVDREHAVLREDTLPKINTIDEGLDYGTTYQTVKHQKLEQIPNMIFAIVTTKAKIHLPKTDEKFYLGSYYGMASTLNYYIVPVPLTNLTSEGRLPFMYYKEESLTELQSIYANLADTPDLQDQVVSIAFTSFIPFDLSISTSSDGGIDIISEDFELVSIEGIRILTPKTYVQSEILEFIVTENKYEAFPNYAETKLYMYPYSFAELSNQKGDKVEIHLEEITANVVSPRMRLKVASSVSNMPKSAVWVRDYNVNNETIVPEMEKALLFNEVQDVPIISDYTATYIQGNRNSHNQALINTAINTGSNLAVAGLTSNPYMAISSVTSMLTSVSTLQAKKKDIDNHPPSMKNLGKNANFDISNGINGIWITWKTIKPEYRKKLESYFKLFGYKSNEVKTPNLKTRESWNYIKTVGCMVTGNIIQNDLDEIKKIFDNGITFWHTNDIGNYNLSNNER